MVAGPESRATSWTAFGWVHGRGISFLVPLLLLAACAKAPPDDTFPAPASEVPAAEAPLSEVPPSEAPASAEQPISEAQPTAAPPETEGIQNQRRASRSARYAIEHGTIAATIPYEGAAVPTPAAPLLPPPVPVAAAADGAQSTTDDDEAKQDDPSAYWNAWFEENQWLFFKRRTLSATRKNVQTLTLSIALVPLIENLGKPVGKDLIRIIKETSTPIIRFKVIPIAADNQLYVDSAMTAFDLEVDRARFLKDVAARPPTNDPAQLIEWARKVSVGEARIPIGIRSNASDCTRLALSIWSAGFDEVVDNLSIPVSIVDRQGNGPGCGSDALAINSGLDLFAARVRDKTDDSEARISFDIFEASNMGFTVMTARDANQQAVYAWRLLTPLSQALADDGPVLGEIVKARGRLDISLPEVERASAYVPAANTLRSQLFTGSDFAPDSIKDAADALARFDELVGRQGSAVRIDAQLTRVDPAKQGALLYYAPVRLLAATAGVHVLDRPLRVVEPLASRSSKTPCVARWTVATSSSLERDLKDSDVKAVLNKTILEYAPTSWLPMVLHGSKAFLDYMHDTKPSTLEVGQSEGLIVLAHHGEKVGFDFADGGQLVTPADMKRVFPEGSVAFFGACSTGLPASSSGTIALLNRRNIDGMIVSPFPVRAEYATVLVGNFIKQLDKAYSAREDATLAVLFDRAATQTAGDFAASGDLDRKYRQQALFEYVIAGNPDIRLCVPPETSAASMTTPLPLAEPAGDHP